MHALTLLYIFGAYLGAIALMFMMQLASQSDADRMDPVWLRYARRAGSVAVALSLLYGADYVAYEPLAPWPPSILIVWTVTASVIIRIVEIKLRAPFVGRMVAVGIIKAD